MIQNKIRSFFAIGQCLLILVMLVHQSAVGQGLSISGEVIDAKSNHYIPYVHITIAGTSYGNISNSEGKFYITIPEAHHRGHIAFSCIGYETKIIPIDSLSPTSNKIMLEEATHTLDLLLITNISAREYIERCIENIPNNYINYPASFRGFYLSGTKENGTYSRLLEAEVEVYCRNFLRYRATDDGDTMLLPTAIDHRTYKIKEPSLFHHSLSFDHVMNGKAFLNPENLDSWSFEFVGAFENDHIVLIEANYIDPEKKIDHKAQIFVDSRSFAILKIAYDYTWNTKHYINSPGGSMATAYHRWSGVFNYSSYGGRYFIKSFNYNVTQGIYDRSTMDIISLQELRNELIVTSMNNKTASTAKQVPYFSVRYHPLGSDGSEANNNNFYPPIKSEAYLQMKKDIQSFK